MICCPLDSGDGDSVKVAAYTTPRARKQYSCEECAEPITIGTKHELYSYLHEDSWYSARTCSSCVEIRDHFACGNGYLVGQLWGDLESNFFPDMKAGGPCMEGLSPDAKARMFERRMAWVLR